MDTESTTVWGIDLGTTYSCIARVDEFGRAVVVNNREGDPTTPSVVLFTSSEDVQVGKEAKRQMQLEPDLVCDLVKRRMGDPAWRFEAHGTPWTAPEVSAAILRAIAQDAALQTGEEVRRVVITVPAYFGIAEREATIAAGKMAGLEVVDVLNEPTAAAISYGFAQGADVEETVVVYDLGGGTFDVTVIRLEPREGGGSHIRVLTTGGDHRLGGANWDERIVELLVAKFLEEHPEAPDPQDDKHALADLRNAAEDLKRSLTMRDSARQLVMSGGVRASVEITREEFEAATADLLDRTVEFTRQTLDEAKAQGIERIDRVLLVGGSSFMPAVAQRLAAEFDGWAPELEDPNQAVGKGAALYGFQAKLRDLLERAGDGDGDGAGTTDRLAVQRRVAEEAGVAVATLQRLTETQITNVSSRGFGIKLLNDGLTEGHRPEDFWVDHLIRPNTPLPVDPPVEATYRSVVDNQTSVEIVLMEQAGTELSPATKDNGVVESGNVALTGRDPAGSPIYVTMGMQSNGVLTVTARDSAGHHLRFEAAPESAVLSQAQIEESAAKVQALRRA